MTVLLGMVSLMVRFLRLQLVLKGLHLFLVEHCEVRLLCARWWLLLLQLICCCCCFFINIGGVVVFRTRSCRVLLQMLLLDGLVVLMLILLIEVSEWRQNDFGCSHHVFLLLRILLLSLPWLLVLLSWDSFSLSLFFLERARYSSGSLFNLESCGQGRGSDSSRWIWYRSLALGLSLSVGVIIPFWGDQVVPTLCLVYEC